MDMIQILPNIIAMILSFIATIMLGTLAYKMRGGQLGRIMTLLVIGISLSVTIHAAFELADLFELLAPNTIFTIMGILLSLGSIFFIVAGWNARKTYK